MVSLVAKGLAAVLIAVVLLYLVPGEVDKQYGFISTLPGRSCRDIYQKNPHCRGRSGYYVVVVGTTPNFVYCDMELECGGEKGWMRIADVDATKGDACPDGWRNITSPVAACRAPTDNAGCYSAQFSTHQVPYSRVCGMVIGYKWETCDAFQPISNLIDDPYVDGVSITYGTPRKHIWSYAVGGTQAGSPCSCPCTQNPGPSPPAFVHENYYCEPGRSVPNPVWDGKGCSTENSCCSEPNLPWFYRQIPLTSDKNIEARICCDQDFADESVFIKEIKLFVQ